MARNSLNMIRYINPFNFSRCIASVLLLSLFAAGNLLGQTAHNISTGNLTILGTDTKNYIVTGATTSYRIIVEKGYQGSITLDNVKIRKTDHLAPIRIKGDNSANVLSPVTDVKIILKGYNQLEAGVGSSNDPKTATPSTVSQAAALQVDRGAQIRISSIDPNDDSSGELVARSYHNADGGAGIGGPYTYTSPPPAGDAGSQGTAAGGGGAPDNKNASGGNIIISSGTIFARGGRCGAGIGGGYMAVYPGHIVIFGGNVRAYGGDHSAGIGTGCPNMSGNNGWYALSSSIIALPPAKITATTEQYGKQGLAGANDITYVGDPQSPWITVKTDYLEKNADIYADLSETTSVSSIFSALRIPSAAYPLTSSLFGNTGDTGEFKFQATFKQKVTFFTDASCSNIAKLGSPFQPKSVPNVLTATTIILPVLDIGIQMEPIPSQPLEEGYTAADALGKSYMLKLTYTNATPLTNVVFGMQSVALGDPNYFPMLRYYNASMTELTGASIPTTLSQGMVLYVKVPIMLAKQRGVYTDVLRFTGTFGGNSIGYVRQVVTQRVVYDDSNTNTYIKVAASEKSFTVMHPTTKAINLTLKISHAGLTETYNASDVTAKYLITTEPDFDLALAGNPLNTWPNMTIPVNESQSPTTSVSFTGKAAGTYYIHWNVVSGVVYAHSLSVASPPRENGGFGPYKLVKPEVTLSIDKASIDEGGGAATGRVTLTAKLGGIDLAPAAITIPLTYTGTATRTTDYTTAASITIPQGQNSVSITIDALADYLLEGDETVTINGQANVTVGSIIYSILGNPLSFTIVDKTDGTITVEHVRNAAEPGTNGQLRFKLPGTGATAVSSTKDIKVTYSYSGAPAAANYTPVAPPVATIPAMQNSVTADVLIPINNYVVEGQREVKVTITNVERLTTP